jgi:predicted short-subunit dehydrogenase-like oxidoreductase (DUF2520 family)
MSTEHLTHLWIVGPGRMGLAIGARLAASGAIGRLTYPGRRAEAPAHPLFAAGRAVYTEALPDPTSSLTLLLVTVPDSLIEPVAHDLAQSQVPAVPALHASGVFGSEVLSPLSSGGSPTGSLHPLVAISEPIAGAALLEGAWYGVEGMPAALDAAAALIAALKGRAIRVEASRKPLYHAAAVMASNYIVALLAVGERLLMDAGVAPGEARAALTDLASGSVGNVAASAPERALTGPIARGDTATLEMHLLGLSEGDRSLYSELARHTLTVARRAGLDASAAASIQELLQRQRPSSP